MSTPVAATLDDRLTISSDLLGALEIPAHDIVRFPGGLYGFPECRAFVLLPAARDGFFWLQSTDYSTLSFLLADPFVWFPEYHIDLDDADLARLGSNDPQHLLVLAIVTMPAGAGDPCTANLHAPLLINVREHTAHQSIRPDDGYGIREPFYLEQPPAESAVVGAL